MVFGSFTQFMLLCIHVSLIPRRRNIFLKTVHGLLVTFSHPGGLPASTATLLGLEETGLEASDLQSTNAARGTNPRVRSNRKTEGCATQPLPLSPALAVLASGELTVIAF